MRVVLFIVALLVASYSFSQTDLISNGNFSSSNNWTKFGDFYINSRFTSYRSEAAYAYLSESNGDRGNNLVGEIGQSISIPSTTTSAKFKFYYSIRTDETSSAVRDILEVTFSVNGAVVWTAITLSNADKTTTTTSPSYKSSGTLDLPASLYGKNVRVAFHGTTNATLPTVFRIDDVSLIVTTSGTGGGGSGGGGSSNCINWSGGSPDTRTKNITDFLCQQGVIPPSTGFSISDINGSVTLQEVCVYMHRALAQSGMPGDFQYYPNIQTATDFGVTPEILIPVKAMLFLEYGDGIAPLNRDYFKIGVQESCSIKKALRIICEALDISPTFDSYYDKFSSSTSNTPYSNIRRNDPYYGYIKRAKDRGWLSQITSSSTLPETMTRKQLWEMLFAVFQASYVIPAISTEDFFQPNNFSAENSAAKGGIEHGIFNDYAQTLLTIPTYSFPLQFGISYHSDLIEMPSVAKEDENNANLNHVILQRTLPLGRGWTHSYHFLVQVSTDKDKNDELLIFRWPDGTTHYYNFKDKQYVTLGVYDKLSIKETSNGGRTVKELTIRTKDNVTYSFTRDTGATILYLTSVTDQNDNQILLSYETGATGTDNEAGPKRLKRVSIANTNAFMDFEYKANTNYLKTVTDNTGRACSFTVDRDAETLTDMTNARGKKTSYEYGNRDESFLLQEIKLPKGNRITNAYQKRKLLQTSNSKYTIDIAFTPTYTASATSSTTKLTLNNQGSATKTITYSNNKNGVTTSIKSSAEDVTIEYKDTDNPTLPTKIVDNNTDIKTEYKYDSRGNITEHEIDGKQTTTITHQYSYNDDNTLKFHRFPNQAKIEYEYDAKGNLWRVKGPLNFYMDLTRNSYGQITQFNTPSGSTVGFEYNGAYRQLSKKRVYATEFSEQAEYDAQGRISALITATGIRDEMTYDENGSIKKYVQDTKGFKLTTSYTYDDNDNLKEVKNPRKNDTYLYYDDDTDDLIEEQYGNNSKFWKYREDGKLDQFESKKGTKFDFTYFTKNDANEGRMKTNGYQRFAYDPDNRNLTSVTSEAYRDRVLSYSYDGFQRINEIRFNSNQFSSKVGYTYDEFGNLSEISMPTENKSYKYQYDLYSRTTSVYDGKDTAVKYTYTLDGKVLSERFSNGVIVNYNYNFKYGGRCDSIWSTRSNGTLLHAVGCSYDSNGLIIRESLFVDTTNSRIYNYSNLWPDERQTYDNDDRPLINGYPTTSDGNGNIINYGGITNATYDPYDNLLTGKSNGKDLRYEYDAFENRYRNGSIYYGLDYLNHANVLYTKPSVSAPIDRLYLHSEHGLVCDINPATYAKRFYLYDMRGSTVALIDNSQKISARYRYDPYGMVTEASEDPGTSSPFLFVGKYGVMLETSYLYFMRARYYDPTTGRFTGEDPIWSTNLFPYAGNDPINNIDPMGLYFETALDAASLVYDLNELSKEKKILNYVFVAVDIVAIVLPGVPGSYLFKIAGKASKTAKGVQANKIAGDAFRDEIASLLRQSGKQVETEIPKWTPFGRRVLDIEVSQNGKILGAIETKVGNSRYTSSQRAKDYWLKNFEGYIVNIIRQ